MTGQLLVANLTLRYGVSMFDTTGLLHVVFLGLARISVRSGEEISFT